MCTFGIRDGSQYVLGFAYNVISMYYCIYVYTGGDVCAAAWGRCSRCPGNVRRGFRSSRFLVSGGWGCCVVLCCVDGNI